MNAPLRAVRAHLVVPRALLCVLITFALVFAAPAAARAGENPDARFAIDLRAGSAGTTCASLEGAYPSCGAFSREIAPGPFEAVIVLYNFSAVRAAGFTLRWPAGWRIDEFTPCADLMIGGEIGTNPMPVALAWVVPRTSPGGTGGVQLGILRGEASSAGCIELLGPDEGETLTLIDAAYQTDQAVEWFDACAGLTPPGDPCAFITTLRAAFDVLNPEGAVPDTVLFIDRSTGLPVSWSWEFGDGGTSTLRNPSHVYTACGTYDVRLTVSNGTAQDDTLRQGAARATGTTQASFAVSPPPWCLEADVFFTDTSSGGPTSWSWNFGDGGTSTEQNPSHRYLTRGDFEVSLSIAGPCGTSSCQNPLYVSATPVAAASYSPTGAHCAPHSFNFNDMSTDGPTAWLWEFGDGESSSERSPAHRYLAPGTYPVYLTAMNGCGSSPRTLVATITLDSYLLLHFSTVPDSGCAPLAMQFVPSFEGTTPDSLFWDFGDGGTSTQWSPTHTYNSPGLYTVILTAYAACGVQTERKGVAVAERPSEVSFSSTTRYAPAPPLSVTFTATSARIATYYWVFGDGATGTGQVVTHEYTSTGTFGVRLTAATACSVVVKKPRYIKVGGANDLAADADGVAAAARTATGEGNATGVQPPEAVEVFAAPWLGDPAPMPSAGPITIELGLPPPGASVRVDIYDSRGRHVSTLAERAFTAGRHRVEWNGTGASGRRVPSGIYFLRMETEAGALTRKLILTE